RGETLQLDQLRAVGRYGEVNLREVRQRIHSQRVPSLGNGLLHPLDVLGLAQLIDDRPRAFRELRLEIVGQKERRFGETELEVAVEPPRQIAFVRFVQLFGELLVEEFPELRVHLPIVWTSRT